VRAKALISVLTAALALAAPAPAQFNPQGRTKKAKPPSGAPAAKPKKPAQQGATPAPAKPDDTARPPAAEKPAAGPSRDVLIARYFGAAMAQPGADFPVERLVELYRERDGNTGALVAELERRAAAPGAERYPALLALAFVQKLDGRLDQALATYERAAAERPTSPAADIAVARVLEQRGDRAGARTRYDKALERAQSDAEREPILRTLLALSLELADFDGARRYHRELVKRAGGSFFVRSELGRELYTRGHYEQAVAELREVVKAAAGDNRVLAPALRDLGRALARSGKRKEALVELERALGASGGAAGVRREVYETIAEVYRADGRLPELTERLERAGARDADELRLLAALYEESGRIDQALATYKKVLARDAGDIATRLKVVSLLEAQGSLDQAVREYEALIRSAPRNPEYVFRLASTLLQRGERARALAELERLEARSGADVETLAALVDLYERLGEKQKSMALLQRVAAASGSDPEHLVELGTRYWVEGDKAKALATWKRIRNVGVDRAQALLVLGEVYLNHDLVKEALETLSEAVKLDPKQWRFKKAYAIGLERAGGNASSADVKRGHLDAALQIWEQILRDPGSQPDAQREARQHLVTLWGLRGQLNQRVNGLAKRFAAKPPDLEAGRLVAEAATRTRRYPEAERALRRLAELSPTDASVLGELERVLVLERKLADAIVVLERLVVLEPKRAREHYQRMAEYAAELYRDDDAIAYAARAVELSPDDAAGHEKLGRMYRRRQQNDKAISEFRQAIVKNERAFAVHLELAELLMGQGELDEADRLLRRVVRACPDDELVVRAARLAVQLNLGRGTLESFEREVLPVALANPDRPLFRRLLVDVYGALAYPLLERARRGSPSEAAEAKSALAKLGERAVKPLLDALGDERAAQQQTAITLLTHVGSKSAGPALVAYASSNADPALRVRAMIAAGTLRDPALLPRLQPLLVSGGVARADDSDPVVVAAAWAVARLRSPRAKPELYALANSEAPNLRALGAIGLGLLGDKSAVPVLKRMAASGESGNVARAAAARSLGLLGARGESETLAELARSPDPTLRASALTTLGCLKIPEAASAIADALVSPVAELRTAAGTAAVAWSTGDCRTPADALPPPEGRVEVRETLDGMRPGPYTTKERVDALERFAPELARSSALAARSSPERARAVVEALGLGAATAPVPALVGDAKGEDLERARRAIAGVASGMVPIFAGLARHPYAEVRVAAIDFLGSRADPVAREAVARAIDDREPLVRRSALAAVTKGNAAGAGAAARLLGAEEDWALRVLAAEALARSGTPEMDDVLAALELAARSDGYALVREAAARALFAVSPARARGVLTMLAKTDAERRVRDVACELLGGCR
jgi:tetratricopeptide (TPR) repeat protein